jgi:hypothetical protein
MIPIEIECNIILSNEAYTEEDDQRDPVLIKLQGKKKSEISKYIKSPLTFFPADVKAFYRDIEDSSWTIIHLLGDVITLDMKYKEFKEIRRKALEERFNILKNLNELTRKDISTAK